MRALVYSSTRAIDLMENAVRKNYTTLTMCFTFKTQVLTDIFLFLQFNQKITYMLKEIDELRSEWADTLTPFL